MDEIALYVATATDQATEIERLREALIAIKGWVDAYPVEVFPPVDLDAVRATLGEPLYTKLHAEWARHILSGIKRYVEAGLS